VSAGLTEDAPAQAPPDTGTWQIEPAPEKDAKQEQVSLRSPAIENDDATLTLRCRPEVTVYEFVIRDARLAKLPPDAVSIAMGRAHGEQVRLMGAARPDGSVLVQERVHQITFSSLLALFMQHDAERVELAIGDDGWAFPAHGFAAALPLLTERCGFEPDPTRALRHR
jgi:hypothetical protein